MPVDLSALLVRGHNAGSPVTGKDRENEMTTWFVSRHEGALQWAREEGVGGEGGELRLVDEITPEAVALGDIVIGTLPLPLVAGICARGARYLHIAMEVPRERRGSELSAQDMRSFGAACREFVVVGMGEAAPAPRAQDAPPAASRHVCLVSAQYMANLLPILKRRPQAVELVCTPEMKQPGSGLARLTRALEHFGYAAAAISVRDIDSACSTDFESARLEARRLRDELLREHPGCAITLNLTGGTKTLSTAFFVEFQGFEVIYTDSQHGNCIRFLDGRRDAEPLGSQFSRVEDYLYCQGYEIIDAASRHPGYVERARGRRKTTELLARSPKLVYILALINKAVEKTEIAVLGKDRGKNLKRVAKLAALDRAGLENYAIADLRPGFIQDELSKAGLLTKTAKGGYAFASADAMVYLSGGWLEEWVWLVAESCKPDCCAVNVFIRSLANSGDGGSDDKADNELDLVVLHNNRLLIAECKTIHWAGANGKQDIFNKLDALGTHARGLFGESLLVSSRALDEAAVRRASAYGVRVIQEAELSGLKREIRRWMGVPAA